MPAARGRVCQLSPDSCGFTPRPPLSLGLDDPYPFKRSLFGGGDYHVPRDFLRTGLFGLGLSVRGFSSLLAVTVFTCSLMLLWLQRMMSTWELTKWYFVLMVHLTATSVIVDYLILLLT